MLLTEKRLATKRQRRPTASAIAVSYAALLAAESLARGEAEISSEQRTGDTMKWLWLLGALMVLATVVIIVLKRHLPAGTDGEWPFYARRPLSTPEQILYHRLVKALPDHIVLAQVQVSRVLGVKKGFNFHQWNNRINRLSFDYVICSKDATVLAAMELDDRTHDSATRAGADAKKERATAAGGVRLIRWHVKSLPDVEIIRTLFPTPAGMPTHDEDTRT